MRRQMAVRVGGAGLVLAAVALLTIAGCIGSSGSSQDSGAANGSGGAGSGGNGTAASGAGGSGGAASESGSGGGGAGRVSSSQYRKFPLDTLPVSTLTVKGHAIRAWLAISDEQHQEGLMYVPADEIADDQGMLFVFDNEWFRSFWMKNTITPLDIAFIKADGTIVKTHTMPPLTTQSFPSGEPAMFALEVKAGTWERLGVGAGDKVDIPRDVFKTQP
ncbi:MAG: hypothetical protein CHACPFDD_02037 [Phycisphaerae bacterium]|nr:hypothetical protein [Phycisphaerae bacterium]